MKSRVRQEIIMSTMRVKGAFRYGDIFQILPMYPEARVLEYAIGHHPCLLEYRYNVPDVEETKYNPALPQNMIDSTLDDDASSKVKKWILLVLSVLSKSLVFQYGGKPNEHQWFVQLPVDLKDHSVSDKPLYGCLGYHNQGLSARVIYDFSKSDAAFIRRIDFNEYYNSETPQQYVIGKTSDEFELPDKIHEYLGSFIALVESHKKTFLCSSYMFRQGVQLFYQAPSLAFAACVSSLEALIQIEHEGEPEEPCEKCQQVQYHVTRKFLDFISRYGNDSKNTKKVAEKIYKRRSAILHRGQLYPGEGDTRTMEEPFDWILDDEMRRDVIRFFRICIINWLTGHQFNSEAL